MLSARIENLYTEERFETKTEIQIAFFSMSILVQILLDYSISVHYIGNGSWNFQIRNIQD